MKMKIKVFINLVFKAVGLAILVTCKELTPQVEKLLAAIRILDKQITTALAFVLSFSCTIIITTSTSFRIFKEFIM